MKSFDIWTGHNYDSLVACTGVVLPFFHYTDSPASNTRWAYFHASFYEYRGAYVIDNVHIALAGSQEVCEFIVSRPEAQKSRTVENWSRMFYSDWFRVRVTRCSEDSQLGNPMVDPF